MLSSVLSSERAILVNVAIMRAFVRLREMIASHKDLARRLAELEKKYDSQFKVVFDAIRQLMEPAKPKPQRIGFHFFLREPLLPEVKTCSEESGAGLAITHESRAGSFSH